MLIAITRELVQDVVASGDRSGVFKEAMPRVA
jgi:hypothetical protein